MSNPQYRQMEEEITMQAQNTGRVDVEHGATPRPRQRMGGQTPKFDTAFDFTNGESCDCRTRWI
ncbi:hypothetical protein E2C01_062335 [Portunus trituberculatus]|uniref:Uncharacterized protein n=1 Tax=Portunus trituberculatus TaxID=210409 RepID=A0A5B7HH11_PORTR|nr:hypothetical protein [Portunus trituberculatus]